MRSFLLVLSLSGLAFAAEPKTQLDLNTQAGKSRQEADRELNDVWKQLLAANADDAALVARLTTAQKAWLAFRDAQVKALYGESTFSARSMCEAGLLVELTRERTAYLKSLLNVEVGDICAATMAPEPKPKK